MVPPSARPLAAIVLLLGLSLFGCSSSSDNPVAPTSLDQETADDLALQTSLALDAAGTEFETMILTASAPAAAALRPEHADHDTTFMRGNLTFTMRRTLYDAADQPVDHGDPNAVRMVATFRVFGSREGPRDTTEVGRAAVHELRGIEPAADTLRFNGASNDTLMNHFRSLDGQRQRHFYWESATTASDLRVLKSAPDMLPLSGRITMIVRADQLRSGLRGDVERRVNAVITVVFDGTPTPVVTVNGRWRYHWNLDDGGVTRM